GTNVITGTGTLWNNPIFGIASGQMIFVPGAGQVVIYEILAVDSDTKIRVTKNISSAITNSEYAIVTTVSNSMSDLARRTAVQLALYQQFLEDWQNITTGTGDVTIIAPDGTEVVIPALSWITDSKTWFDANRELIDNAGEAVAGAETARDEAVAAKTAAQSAEAAAEGSATSASGSATTASDAAAAATDSASIASEAATIATQGKDGAVTARDEAEQFAESVNPDLLMHTTGGTFTGPVILAGDATDPKGAVTKQQLETHLKITNNLSEIKDAGPVAVAQTLLNLGLGNLPTFGDAASKNVGTTAGTVAAGDDSRIVNAVQPSNPALCTAWVNFNGVAPATIKSSHNVSSITRLSTGKYKINFTEPMNNINYCPVASMADGANTGSASIVIMQDGTDIATASPLKTINDFTVYIRSPGSAYDSTDVNAIVYGGK
ncbi:phage tail protein, partial [Yersinia enterocolitica]